MYICALLYDANIFFLWFYFVWLENLSSIDAFRLLSIFVDTFLLFFFTMKLNFMHRLVQFRVFICFSLSFSAMANDMNMQLHRNWHSFCHFSFAENLIQNFSNVEDGMPRKVIQFRCIHLPYVLTTFQYFFLFRFVVYVSGLCNKYTFRCVCVCVGSTHETRNQYYI